MKSFSIAVGLVGVVILPHLANAQAVDDPFSNYLQRSQGISMGAGNANDTNEAIQTITPWPPYVGNPRIPVEGRRAVESIERMYRVPDPFVQQGPGGAPPAAGSPATGTQAGVSPTGLSVTPMQPISGGN
jgi:hypothetical protein